jgi:hypothetical protein
MRLAGTPEIVDPAGINVLDDDVPPVPVRSIDRYEHVWIVAREVESFGIELDIEVGSDHSFAVHDQVFDLTYATPLAVDDIPPARIGLVWRHAVPVHTRQPFKPTSRRILVGSHGYSSTSRVGTHRCVVCNRQAGS